MTRTLLSAKIIGLILLAALMLIGCRSGAPPVQFYTLSATRTQAVSNTIATPKPISIGVGPVVIPEALDRPQIVVRTSPNKLQIDEFHRWAGRLDADLARVVAQNISLMLPAEQVAVYPWDASFVPQYQVTLDIRNFEGRLGEDVLLEVVWKVIDPRAKTTLSVNKSVITEPLPDGSYDTLITAQSKTIEYLSSFIVKEIKRLN
jgi:uncharacterized lipoprotein YmbA